MRVGNVVKLTSDQDKDENSILMLSLDGNAPDSLQGGEMDDACR